jgi:hypothetical protein
VPQVDRHRKKFLVAAIIAALGSLSACPREWYLTIVSGVQGRPEFCISRSPNCAGEGVQMSSLVVTEVDRRGAQLAVVWSIQNHSEAKQDYVLKKVVYGQVPKGWSEDRVAEHLRAGGYYSVSGEYYFTQSQNNGWQVYSRADFLKTGG